MITKYDYKTSLKCWETIRASESDPRKRAERMLEQGVIPLGDGQIAFDPILTSEALGEAEKAEALELQAEAYKRIGTFWGKLYPALTLSIWRNAERLYKELNQEQELTQLRMNLALSCFLTGDKYETLDTKKADQFKKEACTIVRDLPEPDSDAIALASYRQIKGTILRDGDLLRQARSFYEQEEQWDAAISCLDEEIRLALDNNHRQEALLLMQLVIDYAIRLGDYHFAQDVEEKMTHIDELQNGPRIFSKPVEEQTLLDVLDVISYYEERVIFHPIRITEEKIGKTMDDKKFIILRDGHLMPKFREQMRLFRGESEYHKVCKPTLWRKDMDDKAIFLERLRLAEFQRVLGQMPEIFFFVTGILISDPDGGEHHIPLHVDGLALAQHYGIKTELLDLTADKWVAAFFACTTYDKQNDTYNPIVSKTDEKGVIYCYHIKPDSFESGKLNVVGAQPFERPTEQAAFSVNMEKGDNFNDICTDQSFFCQDPMTSIIVYHFANRADRMFPQELIQSKVRLLILDDTNKRFSPEIINWVRNVYYSQLSDGDFQRLMESIEIGDVGEYHIRVSDEEQIVKQSHFLRFMRLQSMIEVQWFRKLDVKEAVSDRVV